MLRIIRCGISAVMNKGGKHLPYNIDVLTNVCNLDETFVCFDLKNRRIITERNAKTVFQLSSIVGEQLEHITILAFVTSEVLHNLLKQLIVVGTILFTSSSSPQAG